MNDHHPPQHVGFQERWVQFAPTEAPKIWLGINILCCTYSVLLGLVLALASDDADPREMLLAKHSYLIYDWLLCTIWVVEVGLTWMQYNLAGLRNRGEEDIEPSAFSFMGIATTIPWYIVAELVVAVYFCMSSVYFVFFRSWDEGPDVEEEPGVLDMWFDIIVNALAYLYVSVELWKRVREGWNPVIDLNDDVEGSAYGSLDIDVTELV